MSKGKNDNDVKKISLKTKKLKTNDAYSILSITTSA